MKRFVVAILFFQSLGIFSRGIDIQGMTSSGMVSRELHSQKFCEQRLTTSNVTVDFNYKFQLSDTTKPSDSIENVYSGTVDVQATYPGGTDAFYRYLSSNLKYPERCKDEELTGKVIIRFLVDKTGSITQISVVKDVKNCPEFAHEAIRVIRKSKRWIPAQQNGRFVNSWMQIPVQFEM